MGPVASHDATIAAIEAAFKEFEEEKADIYEMGKIAKVGDSASAAFNPNTAAVFVLLPQMQTVRVNSSVFLQACGCPLYWKAPMFYSAGGERTGFVSVHSFVATWRK